MKRGVILIIIFLLSITIVEAAVRIDPFFPSASQNLRCTISGELEPYQFKWYINNRLVRESEQFESTSIVAPRQIFYTNDDVVKCEVYVNTGGGVPWERAGQAEVTVGAFACNDGFDNDRDGTVDFNDPGCSAEFDDSEVGNAIVCDDGIDNDRDGRVDTQDPGCYRNPRETDEGRDNYFTNNCLTHPDDLFCSGLGFSDLKLLCDRDPRDSKCTSPLVPETFRQCANSNDPLCVGVNNVVNYCIEDYRNNICRFILSQKNICNNNNRAGCFFLSRQDKEILCSVDSSYSFCVAVVVTRAGNLGQICIEGDTCLEGECVNDACQLVGGVNLPCRPNNLCDAGLTCQNSVCFPPQLGSQSQGCNLDGSCNSGLECVNNICVQFLRGGVNLPCRTTTPFCDQGLTCQSGVCFPPPLQRGGINQECLLNNICNADLLCQNNICQQPKGNVNEPCLSGNVCFNGLICVSNICQVPVGPQEGDEGGLCRNNLCNNNLVCIDGRCGMPQGPQPGEEGGVCVDGNLCLSGLICNNHRCQIPQGPLPGAEGGECLASGLCNAGLRCKNTLCEKIPGWQPEPARKRPTPQQPIIIIQPAKLLGAKQPIVEPVAQPFSNNICGDNWCDFTEDAVSCPNDCVLEVKQQNDDYFKLKLLIASLILVFFFFTIVAYKEAFAVFARALKKQ